MSVIMGYFDDLLKRLSDLLKDVLGEEEHSRFQKLLENECTFESILTKFTQLIEFATHLLLVVRVLRQVNNDFYDTKRKEIDDDLNDINERVDINNNTNLQSKGGTKSRGIQDKHTYPTYDSAKRNIGLRFVSPYSTLQDTPLQMTSKYFSFLSITDSISACKYGSRALLNAA